MGSAGMVGDSVAGLIGNNQVREEPFSVLLGSLTVAALSVPFTLAMQRFQYRKFYPLTLYNKRKALRQLRVTPLVAMGLFLAHHGLVGTADLFSDQLRSRSSADTLNPNLPSFSDANTRALVTVTAIDLLRLPIYYFAVSIAPFALIPGIMPWKSHSRTPPYWQWSIAALIRSQYEFLVPQPSRVDPTPKEIEAVLNGLRPEDVIVRERLAMLGIAPQ